MLLGVLLILIAVAVIAYELFYGSTNLYPYEMNLTRDINTTLAPNSTRSMQFNYTNGTVLVFLAHTNRSINFYLMNRSGYALFESSNAPKYEEAVSLEGKGTVLVYNNATNASFPVYYDSNLIYQYPNSSNQIATGTYYFIADNTKGSRSSSNDVSLNIAYVPNFYHNETTATDYQNFVNSFNSEKTDGEIGGFLFIIGIVVILYGFISKRRWFKDRPTPQKEPVSDEEIDRMYRSVSRKDKNNKAGTKKHTVKNSGRTKDRKRINSER